MPSVIPTGFDACALWCGCENEPLLRIREIRSAMRVVKILLLYVERVPNPGLKDTMAAKIRATVCYNIGQQLGKTVI